MKLKTDISCLMRVGPTEEIERCFAQKTITFGCAANWINYALTKNNNTVGDLQEGIYAHVPKEDPRIDTVIDKKGNPMGNHLLVLENLLDKTCLLRHIPTILKPVLCFYSFNIEKVMQEMGNVPCVYFDAQEYLDYMGYEKEKTSFLLVTNPEEFLNDLKNAVPLAVEENRNNLTDKRFYTPFNKSNPVLLKLVDYTKYSENTIFWDLPENGEELFWKCSSYQPQSEARIVINNLNFVQTYNPKEEYNYEKNRLNVILPNFENYTKIFPADQVHKIFFSEFDKELHTYKIKIV